MNVPTPYDNVTILYGHIHRHHFQQNGKIRHYAARSLIFTFNNPATNQEKKQLPFNKDDPFKELGIRKVAASGEGDGRSRERCQFYSTIRPPGWVFANSRQS